MYSFKYALHVVILLAVLVVSVVLFVGYVLPIAVVTLLGFICFSVLLVTTAGCLSVISFCEVVFNWNELDLI